MNSALFRLILIVITVFSGYLTFAQKTDTIIHVNGNVLLGEIKKLDNGIISFKMDGMGTIKFELDKVNTFSSKKHFQFIVKNGIQYFGSFDTSAQQRMVKIVIMNGSETIPIDNIVEMYPIKKNFWLRTSGVFSLGFSFSKGSGIANLNTSGKLDYRNRKSYTVLNWTENATIQDDSVTSNKSDASLDFQRVLFRRWYAGINAELSSNSELGLELRTLGGFSLLNYLVHNNHNRLFMSVGASGNREWAETGGPATNNIEGLLGVNYHLFRYTTPEINVTTYINAYPSFTIPGRWRLNYSLDAKVEVINDFSIGINFYYNFDNKPVSVDASTSDYGITTTFSYSFH